MLEFETPATHRDKFPYHTTSQKGMTMTAIDTKLSVLNFALDDLLNGAQEETAFQNANGWNDKGITLDNLRGKLFFFAIDNIETMEELAPRHRMTVGAYVVIALLHGAEHFDPVGSYEWDTSSLGL